MCSIIFNEIFSPTMTPKRENNFRQCDACVKVIERHIHAHTDICVCMHVCMYI